MPTDPSLNDPTVPVTPREALIHRLEAVTKRYGVMVAPAVWLDDIDAIEAEAAARADTHGHTGNGTFCQTCVNVGAADALSAVAEKVTALHRYAITTSAGLHMALLDLPAVLSFLADPEPRP